MKVGDKVIVKKRYTFDKLGQVLEISIVYGYGIVLCLNPESNDVGHTWSYLEDGLIPEHLYNSPLYKVLR
jgi:hypothetical protein